MLSLSHPECLIYKWKAPTWTVSGRIKTAQTHGKRFIPMGEALHLWAEEMHRKRVPTDCNRQSIRSWFEDSSQLPPERVTSCHS